MQRDFRSIPAGTVSVMSSFAAGPGAPLVHFAHGTGMCAGLYRSLLDRLAGHVNVVAVDARGHGATTLPADPAALADWAVYADDLAALLDGLPLPPRLILAGHSMGATVSLELAARLGGRVAAVVLVEPAFVPFAVAPSWRPGLFVNPMAARAARRRAVWPSRAAMAAAYAGRGMFATWSNRDLRRYLDDGVRDRADGQVELACAPAWEAATFTAVSAGVEAALRSWRGALALLHGTVASTVMPVDAVTIAARPDTIVRCFAGRDHFLPLAEPGAVADAILAFV